MQSFPYSLSVLVQDCVVSIVLLIIFCVITGRAHQPHLCLGKRNIRAAKQQSNQNHIREEKNLSLECKLTRAKTKLTAIQVSAIYAESARDKAKEYFVYYVPARESLASTFPSRSPRSAR